MQANGWIVDITDDNQAEYSQRCSNATWFGFNNGRCVGSISATFNGQGKAILNFGNCGINQDGLVLVSLNNKEIGRAAPSTPEEEITFEYSQGDTLLIKEGGNGIAIIALNSLRLLARGIYYTTPTYSLFFKTICASIVENTLEYLLYI